MSSVQMSPNVALSGSGINLLLERGLNRTKAVITTWLVACVVNFAIFAVGATAGVDYAMDDGKVWSGMGVGVVIMTTLLLLPGLIVAALVSLRHAGFLRFAQIAGPAIAIVSIGLTYAVDFDTTSATFLALTHVATAPIIYYGLELIRRRDSWSGR